MNFPPRNSAFTWLEALVCVVVVVVLCSLLVPTVNCRPARGPLYAALSNARQFQLATMQMATESLETGRPLVWTTVYEEGKPPRPATFAEYRNALVSNGYITENDLRRLITAPGRTLGKEELIAENIAFKFFVVGKDSPDDQPFIVSANWTTAGLVPVASWRDKGFVVFNKGGGGNMSNRPSDATSTNMFPADPKLGYSTETLK